MLPPSEAPKTAARSEPAASRTSRISSMRCSSVGRRSLGTLSERPVPRLSNRIKREKDASLRRKRAYSGTSQLSSTFEIQPGTQIRSNGPSPTT